MPLSKKELLRQKFLKEKRAKASKSSKKVSKASTKLARSLSINAKLTLDGFDFTTPTTVLQSLLSPFHVQTFFDKHWETEPLIIKRSTSSNDYDTLFSFNDLQYLVNGGVVRYGTNVNVCRYVNGERETLNGQGIVTSEEFNDLWRTDKATFQFHQPQQFKDILWKLLSMLETYFSCLVGANVYITPSGSQGLAPHYDDVEVFILQLEGKKHWRLYPPTFDLPETCSDDLKIKDIGQPSHDLILETGDLMYFPRGTIHHADTPPDVTHSTHITISTYQNHSRGNFLRQAIPLILEELITTNPLMRKGMPLNYLALPNGHSNPQQPTTTQPIDDVISETTPILMNLLSAGTMYMKQRSSIDFISSRLPPYYGNRSEIGPKGVTPSVDDHVVLCWPDHTHLHLGGPEWVYVYHSLINSRRSHMMMSSQKPKGLKFPFRYFDSLELIFNATGQAGIAVSSLPLPSEDQRSLVMTLWAEGLLCTV